MEHCQCDVPHLSILQTTELSLKTSLTIAMIEVPGQGKMAADASANRSAPACYSFVARLPIVQYQLNSPLIHM